jgi:MFS family permease
MIETKYEKVRKSLRYSVLDGTFNAMKIGFGESFFQAFAALFKASDFQIGLIGSLPQALGSFFQLFSYKLIKGFRSRQRFVCFSVFLELLMYIPIALIFFFGSLKVIYLIIFICIYWVFSTIAGPAWNSWMGDLVSENNRGTYFGRRNKITGIASFVSLLIGGYILQMFSDGTSKPYIGFAIIFFLALISRAVSLHYLTKKYEPEYSIFPSSNFGFIDFLKQARFRNYGLFVIYLSFMNFAVYLATPFFAGYMLYDLKWDYMTFTLINAVFLIVKYALMPVWGKACDKYGSKKVLSLAGYLMPLNALLWMFSTNVWYIALVQVYSGFVWAGFEIASFSFIFDTTTPQKRATCVAYYNVLSGFALFLGAIAGGLFVKYNNIFWSSYLLVFLLSTIIRYAASFIFIPKLKEIRGVRHITYRQLLLNIITTMPASGFVNSIIMLRKR